MDYYYTGGMPRLEFIVKDFTVDPPICNVDYSCEVVDGPRTDICYISESVTRGLFNPMSGKYLFRSTDMANFPAGTYQFKFTGSTGSKSASVTLNLHLIDVCDIVEISLNSNPFYDETYTLGDDEQW